MQNYLVLIHPHGRGRKTTLDVYAVNRNRPRLLAQGVPQGCRQTDQAVCDIIAGKINGMSRFPKGFAPPSGSRLSEQRTFLHYSSGMTLNYPAFLLREKEAITLWTL